MDARSSLATLRSLLAKILRADEYQAGFSLREAVEDRLNEIGTPNTPSSTATETSAQLLSTGLVTGFAEIDRLESEALNGLDLLLEPAQEPPAED